MPIQTQSINHSDSLRDKVITPGEVSGSITPGQSSYTPTAGPQQVSGQQVNTSGLNIAGGVGSVGPAQQASGGSRLSHNIGAQSVMRNAMDSFNAQLPQMDIQFADTVDAAAKRTSALGRTGSGLFNRETGYISDRGRAARESLLGNLSFNAAQTDAANSLQAQISQQGLREQQEGRFANTGIANMQSANQMGMAGAQNALQAALANQSTGLSGLLANQGTNLQAQLANQSANMGNNQFNAQMGMQNQQFNVGNDLQAQMQNMMNQINQNQFGANFAAGQQGRQDMLASQAQQDLAQQLQFLQQGFQGDPTSAMGQAAGGISNLAQMYGNQAGQANQGIAGGTAGLLDMLMGGGGPMDALPPQGVAPQQSFNPIQNSAPPGSLWNPGPAPIGLQPSSPQGMADPDSIFYRGAR